MYTHGSNKSSLFKSGPSIRWSTWKIQLASLPINTLKCSRVTCTNCSWRAIKAIEESSNSQAEEGKGELKMF
jgi:hypothetical protein